MLINAVCRGLLDAVYPPICLLCGRLSSGDFSHCCSQCLDSFEGIGSSFCHLCGRPFLPTRSRAHRKCLSCLMGKRPYTQCRTLFFYRGAFAEALIRFKYRGQTSMQGPLASAMMKALEGACPLPDAELVIPVPMSFTGLWKRGFNQSCLLAGVLSRELDLELAVDVLKRKGNRTQVGLSARGRRKNASESFFPGRSINRARGRSVLLFDDVYTTGATVEACARILLRAGAEVSVLTFARADPPGPFVRPVPGIRF